MKVAIDSNILIALLSDEELDETIKTFFENIKENHEGILCPIALAEILVGLYFTKDCEKAINDFMLFLEDNNIKVVSLNEKVSLRTAKHAYKIISNGKVGKAYRERKPDLFIISHAEEFGDVFVTKNKKHYKNLKSKVPILVPKEFLDVYLM